ncbi:acyltransferase [Methylophilaceae bacterium]|nr:acyltransferase [Methylophilaceae bacterium]
MNDEKFFRIKALTYRTEIDGLRAIAVLPVILFHAGFGFFSGGFLGVDIFFVISGYLITSIIVLDKQAGKFTYKNFYLRRAKRILPALFTVIIACIPLALIFMPPAAFLDFSKSIISATWFVQNFWANSNIGYFNISAEEMPLLHTWSLSVEEQFYILYPTFLIFFLSLGKRVLIGAITSILIISVSLSQFGGNLASTFPFYDEVFRLNAIPSFAFFLTPTRIFELLAGSLCVFIFPQYKSKATKNFLSVFGLALIVISILVFDKSLPLPGFLTFIPILGTVLIILYGQSNTFVGKFLSSKVLVSIGLISYSLYLWHQPLFAFARISSLNEPSAYVLMLLIAGSFLLAFLTYRFIETPFRHNLKLELKHYLTLMVVVSGIGIVGVLSNGFDDRFDQSLKSKLHSARDLAAKPENYQCTDGQIKNSPVCNFGDINSSKVVILLGNSHARMMIPTLNKIFKENRIKGIHPYQLPQCKYDMPFYTTKSYSKEESECFSSWVSMMKKISDDDDQIIISHRLTSFLEGKYFDNQEGYIEKSFSKKNKNLSNEQIKVRVNSVEKVYEWLVKNYKKITFIYPVPEVGFDVPKAVYLKEYLNISHVFTTNYEVFKTRNILAYNLINRVTEHSNVNKIYPEKFLCGQVNRDRCETINENGSSYYYDSNHLSPLGSFLILSNILKFLTD